MRLMPWSVRSGRPTGLVWEGETIMATVKRQGRTFVGMCHPDSQPVMADDRDVRRVHMLDVPTPLRQHAYESLGDMSGDQWWTVGEFRYTDEPEYDTAVARRVMRNGRMAVEFGVEDYQ